MLAVRLPPVSSHPALTDSKILSLYSFDISFPDRLLFQEHLPFFHVLILSRLNHSASLILTSLSSVVQTIWSRSAMLISVFIVPVVSFPQATTIRHLQSAIWDILWSACMSSASPSSRNRENPNCGQMGTYSNS